MMRKCILIFLLGICTCRSQQKKDITNEARYELNFIQHKSKKPEYLKNTFILLFNKNESCFKNMSNYVMDSLVDTKKIKLTGGNEDLAVYMKFFTDLPFII